MSWILDEQRRMLRDSAQAFVGETLPVSHGRQLRDSGDLLGYSPQAWRAFGEANWPRVGELCVLSSALKTAREARAASENIGRQRAELVALLHAHPLAVEYLRRAAAGSWPQASSVSAALEGRVLGAPLDAVLAQGFVKRVGEQREGVVEPFGLG